MAGGHAAGRADTRVAAEGRSARGDTQPDPQVVDVDVAVEVVV